MPFYILIKATVVFALLLFPMTLSADVHFKQIAEFDIPEAGQGVAVDRDYFYAVDSRAIAKYSKKSGRLVNRWEDGSWQFIHLDSAVAVDGKIYAAHTNWPRLPVISSVEVWNAADLKHISTHFFDRPGLGWLTWLDFYDGYWWGTFAHYDLAGPDGKPYGGGKIHTVLAKLDQDWNIVNSWLFSSRLLEKFGSMSNSGGSWGPDGFLYLTGHDSAAAYRIKIPSCGSLLEVTKILPLNIRGQGIAWDRYQGNTLYGIIRATDAEKKQGIFNKVAVFRFDSPAGQKK